MRVLIRMIVFFFFNCRTDEGQWRTIRLYLNLSSLETGIFDSKQSWAGFAVCCFHTKQPTTFGMRAVSAVSFHVLKELNHSHGSSEAPRRVSLKARTRAVGSSLITKLTSKTEFKVKENRHGDASWIRHLKLFKWSSEYIVMV